MAKFVYRMQSILNIKEKLEDQARNNFSQARMRLNEENEKLETLKRRKEEYREEGRKIRKDSLDVLKLQENETALKRMDEYIAVQKEEVAKAEKGLERAREKLTEAMKESKIQNRLKEKAFEQFKKDLLAEEAKEIDELTSFTHGRKKE